VLDDVGGVLDQRPRRATVKPPTLDQGAHGGMDLADSDFGIFPPAAARGSGPGTAS
jgi:hypothetical protein